MSLNTLFVIVLALGMFVSLGLTLYAEYKKLDELESYFSENETVQYRKRFWGRNRPIDRAMRMSVFVFFFMSPDSYVKSGEVTREELASVPLALKRWATWPFYFSLLYFVALASWTAWREW
ncbi:hypothetical protein [Pseudomonas mucidolens]|uniref:hypothetical protein n=1 Tax=Pseudomonas mucidolens TaxID=46679 RepID=UPI0030DBE961